MISGHSIAEKWDFLEVSFVMLTVGSIWESKQENIYAVTYSDPSCRQDDRDRQNAET